jgi:hypothetical protein
MTLTVIGDWMDQLLLLDGPYIKDGSVQVTDKPGLGGGIESRRGHWPIWRPARVGGANPRGLG